MSGYVIRPGDTLSGIARRQGVSQKALLQANPQIANPNLIRAGATMTLPAGDAAPSPDTVKAAIAQGKAAGGSKDATCTEAVRPCEKKVSALKPAEEDLSGETEAEVLSLDQKSSEYGALEKKIMAATGGLTVAEVQKLYKESTGKDVDRKTLETLFTDPYRAQEILEADADLNNALRDVLNSDVPPTLGNMQDRVNAGEGWILLDDSKAGFHNPEKNLKFVSADGHREAIYDRATGALDDRTIYKGTFNFFGPDDYDGHAAADVKPWMKEHKWTWAKEYGYGKSAGVFAAGAPEFAERSAVKAKDYVGEKANAAYEKAKDLGGSATDAIRGLWQ